MEKIKLIGYASAIVSTMLMGTMGIFVRNISSSGYIITFARLGLGLIFLLCLLFIKRKIKKINIKKISFPLLSTGILMGAGILCYTNAINSTTLANAAFLLYLAPLIAVGIASVFLKERFTLFNAGLLCLAFLGSLLLLDFNFNLNMNEAKGYLWGIAASLTYALYIVINRKIPKEIPATVRSFYQFLFGAITMLPFLDVSILQLTPADYYLLIAIGFFHGFLALTLLIVAVKHLKAVEYGTISYLEPLVASIIGFGFYAESLTLLQIIGCAVIFSGGMIQVAAAKFVD